MTTEHPITPPPKLVEQWYDAIDNSSTSWKQELTTKAARWGADQELRACCEWLLLNGWGRVINNLRAARRPKPPSLAEQALMQLQAMEQAGALDCNIDAIRHALERLQELEKGNE